MKNLTKKNLSQTFLKNLDYIPKDDIELSEDENLKVEKLLEFLEDLEDVQMVEAMAPESMEITMEE